MTLALYGKSRRRQLILLFAAIVAVAAATLGGATLRSEGHAQTTNGPDLVATKTNNVGGTVAPDGSFHWTITLANLGNQDAVIPQHNEIFTDYLPTGVNYAISGASGGTATPTTTEMRATYRLPRTSVSSSADFRCDLLDVGTLAVRISCVTTISNGVRLPAGAVLSLELEVDSLPAAPATLSNPRAGQLCRIDPTNVVAETDESASSNNCSDTVIVAEQTIPQSATLNVKKYLWNGTDYDDDAVGWDFRYQPMNTTANFDTATEIEVDESASVSHGQYRLFENIPAGYRLMGYTVATGGASCSAAGPQNGITNQPVGPAIYEIENVSVDADTTVCFYNQPVRTFTVKKMVASGAGWTPNSDSNWHFRLGPTDLYSEADDVANGVPETVPVATATSFAAFEKVPDGWTLAGWDTVPGADAECPATPSNTFTTPLSAGTEYSANLGTTGDVTACFYNAPETTSPGTNGLTVKKMVWTGTEYREYDSNTDPDFDLRYGPDQFPENAVSITHGVTTQVSFGGYHVWENIPAGWQRVGWTNEANPADLVCPAAPGENILVGPVPNAGAPIGAITEDTSRLICHYNQERRQVTVEKMVRDSNTGAYTAWNGAPDFWGLAYGTTTYGNATPLENGASANLPIGPYFFWENLASGWQYNGYTTTTNASCPAEPGTLLGTPSGTPGPQQTATQGIAAGDPLRICFYNERNIRPVDVTKTGYGTYDIDWSVTKTVEPTSVTIPDDGSDTTEYTVTVHKNYINISAAGNITINNPNPGAINVNVSDPDVTLGGACAANGDVTVPAATNDADGQAVCTWTVTLANREAAPSYSNSASITGPWGDNQVIANSGDINFFTSDLEFVTLTDDFAGPTTGDDSFVDNGLTVTTSDSFTYTGTHTCEGVNLWNPDTGIGTKTVVNIASITDTVGNNNSDHAIVTVNCERPKLTLIKNVNDGSNVNQWVLHAMSASQPSFNFLGGSGAASRYVPSSWPFVLSEVGPAGYTLDRVTCTLGENVNWFPSDGGQPTFQMPTGAQDVTCTFYNVADQPLTIEKTATGTYDDVWTWTIEKDGEITAITREAGAVFGVGYTTTSTPTITGRENGVVSGQVTITNNNDFTIDVTIADSLGDIEVLACEATPGGVYANPTSAFDVPANSVVVCDYTVVDADTAATTNTVTVTSVEYPDLDGSDDATIAWLSNLNAADPAYLKDTDNLDRSPVTRTYTNETATQVAEYARNYQCPAWPNAVYYDDQGNFTGEFTYDIVNTAVLYKNDSLEGDEWDRDDHTVEVTCTVDRGSVDVQKTVDWDSVPVEHQPEASFDICIAGPFADTDAADDFVSNHPTAPFAPNSAPSGDWEACDNVTDGEFAEFDNLVPGVYVIAEKEPGTAWIQPNDPLVVNVEPGDEDRFAGESGITNLYQLGDLTVTKIIELAGGDLPDGSEFDICIQGPSYPIGTEDAACRTFTDGQSETWQDIIPGAYTVTEINTEPDGVQWATTITNNGNVTVNAGAEASATVTNTLVTGDLAVTKVIEWSGYEPAEGDLDGNPWDGFEICIQGPSFPLGTEDGACQVVTNVNGETLQWDNLAAGTYTVIETDPGTQWTVEVDPDTAGTVGVETCEATEGSCETPQVTITNTLAPAELTICKDFVGDETDEGVLPGIQLDGQSNETTWGEDDCFTIDVAPFTPVTVTEVLPEGYFPAQAPVLSGQCTIQPVEIDVAQTIIAQTLSFLGLELVEAWLEADLSGIPAGGKCTVTFTNEPVGELTIVKDDRTSTAEPVTWLFDVTDGQTDDVVAINGNGSDSNTVRTGAYSITERDADGLNRVDICQPNSPAGSYEVSVVVAQGGVVGAEVPGARAEFTIVRGEATTVTFINRDCGDVLGEANLIVRKFAAAGPNVYGGSEGLGGWTMTLECLAGACESVSFPGQLVTDGSGIASFLSVPSGVYELCEVPQSRYTVVGSLLDGGSPVAGTCREVTVSSAAAGDDGNIVVDFFNYEIPEEETPTPENTPTVTPTPEIPDVPNTPTNTPEVPTNTPEPTETPVSPTETPTATPTPIDDVEGEITPGASPTSTPTSTPGSAATPIPPASGTGSFSGGGASILFALLGALAIFAGSGALLLARRR